MKKRDELSNLLQKWQPQSPLDDPTFTDEVMRQIRQTPKEPLWKRTFDFWSDLLDEWLPSPAVLVPAAALLIIFLGGIQWVVMGKQQAKTLAALQWHERMTKPLAKESLTGTYVRLMKKQG